MSKLREMIRARQESETAQRISIEPPEIPPRSLQVDTWNGEKWVLSWGYFYSAVHQPDGESEQLVLSFANREVVVDGQRLALLLPEITDHRLVSLRDLPAKFRTDADPTKPYIERVCVRSPKESSDRDEVP